MLLQDQAAWPRLRATANVHKGTPPFFWGCCPARKTWSSLLCDARCEGLEKRTSPNFKNWRGSILARWPSGWCFRPRKLNLWTLANFWFWICWFETNASAELTRGTRSTLEASTWKLLKRIGILIQFRRKRASNFHFLEIPLKSFVFELQSSIFGGLRTRCKRLRGFWSPRRPIMSSPQTNRARNLKTTKKSGASRPQFCLSNHLAKIGFIQKAGSGVKDLVEVVVVAARDLVVAMVEAPMDRVEGGACGGPGRIFAVPCGPC